MNRKNKILSVIFSLLILLVCGLLLGACGSSVNMSSVRSAEDTEHEKGVTQYKPEPRPATKKEEPKPQSTSKEPTQKTTETKLIYTTKNEICIPDFMSFTNNTAYQVTNPPEIGVYKETHITYVVDANKSAITEYIKLISGKYGFKQTAFKQTSDVGIYEYGFVYTGKGEIGTFQRDFNQKPEKLHFNILWYALGNEHEFQIRYADGISYVDKGDRTSYKLNKVNRAQQSSSGGGSSFDYSSGPEMRKAADEIKDRPCFRCKNGVIEKFDPRLGTTVYETCPDCRGRGRIDYNY